MKVDNTFNTLKYKRFNSEYNYTYWVNDKEEYHRTDGPAIEYANGLKSWYVDGKRHRTDGPAVTKATGYKAWYVDGKLHRTDGPARIQPSGYKEWWIDGEQLLEEEYRKK